MSFISVPAGRVDSVIPRMSESDADCGVRSVKRIVTVRGKMRRDKFFFPVRGNQLLISNVVLDTGAFDFVVSERIATRFGLQRHTSVLVRGVSIDARPSQSHFRTASLKGCTGE
jgi:hypothetical protein